MFVTCETCGGRFRIAPEKVPAAGVRARCAGCASILLLRREGDRVVVAQSTPKAPPEPVRDPVAAVPPPPPAADDPFASLPPLPAPADDPFASPPPPPPADDPFVSMPPPPPPVDDPFASLPPPPPPADDPFASLPPPALPARAELGAAPPPVPADGPFAPPPPPVPDDDPFASLSATPLPDEFTFGGLAEAATEPSFVTGAIPLDPEPSTRSSAGDEASSPPRTQTRRRPKAIARKPSESPASRAFWSLVVLAALAYGALVGLDRDPTRLLDLVKGDGGSPRGLRAEELSSGVVPTPDGGRLTYLVGTIEGAAAGSPDHGILVVGEILGDDDAVVARSEGWAGVLPTPEALASALDEASWRELSRGLARKRQAGAATPFAVAFPGGNAPQGAMRFRVSARPEPLPAPRPASSSPTGPQPASGVAGSD